MVTDACSLGEDIELCKWLQENVFMIETLNFFLKEVSPKLVFKIIG